MTKLNKNQRTDAVFELVIESYLKLGTPISSKFIVNESNLNASPATIRNVMMGLEQTGLIISPHTSAGRIPTTKGLRQYVNRLLQFDEAEHSQVQQLTTSLSLATNPQDMCNRAAKILADMTRLTGLVAMPKTNDVVLRQLELVRLADKRILCVLIDQHDEVQNRVVDLSVPVTDDVLGQTIHMLNSALAGFSLDEGRERLGYFLKNASDEVQNLVKEALFGDAVELNEQVLFRAGETRLLNDEIATDTQSLREVLKAVEDIHPLQNIFSSCCATDNIQVFIAEEIGLAALKNCAVIAKAFYKDQKVAGVMAVIGPKRMDYQSVITAVDLSTNILSSALNRQ
jgi:heat-inducible transcriptional repressor